MGKINLENLIIEQYKEEFGENSVMYKLGRICDKSSEKKRMMKLAKQVLELAAENAEISWIENDEYMESDSDFSFRDSDGNWCKILINQSKILDVINLIE